MAQIRKLKQFKELINRQIVLDANVLIYKFGKKEDNRAWVILYRNRYQQLADDGFNLTVDLLVIAEYVNVAARDAQQELMDENPHLYYNKYKDFRDSPEGVQIMTEIYDTVRDRILVECQLINTELTNQDVQSVCFPEPLDFVDKIQALLCKKHDAVLFTNDADFHTKDIDILSNNDKFFIEQTDKQAGNTITEDK
jgi:predicted nucleic acid-binding protein